MSRIHLSRSGRWVTCKATVQACPRGYHVDNMTMAEANMLPEAFVRTIIEGLEQGPITRPNGDREWRDNHGRLHRDYGSPARITTRGTQEWYRHGKRHRADDLPAVIRDDGVQEWWLHGKRHRGGNRPAIMSADGAHRVWYVQGQHAAPDGRPTVIFADGSMEFWRGDYWLRKVHPGDPAYDARLLAEDWYMRGESD